ncbi:MAG: hypothetical protein KGI25_07045 [Thaumarchaeota archaeon]|nr:hypothetical protein [Nitrososphaerota archaeon]
MSEEFVKNVKTLLASGKGDAGRLREILDSVKQNNPVYMSDYKYIENLISGQAGEEKIESKEIPQGINFEDPLTLLRIRLAEGKMTIAEFRELKKTLSEF